MGKQSSRLYYQGKDHKDIYFQGHYHDAMYVGSQLVWEKIYDERTELWLDEIDSNVGHYKVTSCIMYPDGTVAFFSDYGTRPERILFSGGKIGGTFFENYSSIPFDWINGMNFGIFSVDNLNFFIPELNIAYDESKIAIGSYHNPMGYINGVFIEGDNDNMGGGTAYIAPFSVSENGGALYLKEHMYLDGKEIDSSVVHSLFFGGDYIVNHIYCRSFQWFNGKLYAHLLYKENDYGTCSTSDGFHWFSGEPIVGTGKVINNILFLQNGVAFDENMNNVAYTKNPAFFWNNYYYAKQIEEDNYLLRSKDLVEWEKYRKIKDGNKYTAIAYCSEKRYLCLQGSGVIYKLRINL